MGIFTGRDCLGAVISLDLLYFDEKELDYKAACYCLGEGWECQGAGLFRKHGYSTETLKQELSYAENLAPYVDAMNSWPRKSPEWGHILITTHWTPAMIK